MDPSDSGGRIAVVDLLRGAALFGILAVNIWFFASASVAAGENDPDFTSALDTAATTLTTFFFATKSYLLFAFLFGYSFVLQEAAALRAGRPFVAMMRRRLTGLVLLGLLHGLLLFPGDILLMYGLLGFLLLAMRRLDPVQAVRRGVLLTVIAGVLLIMLGVLAWLAGDGSGPVPGAADAVEAGYRGSARETVAANAAIYPTTLASVLFVQGLPALGAMLVGTAAARVGFFGDQGRQRALWRQIIPAGTAIGLAGAAVFSWGSVSSEAGPLFVGFGVSILTAPLLTATYVALLVGWHTKSPDSPLVRGVASAGRLALTNYLGQSLAMSLIFTGMGLALMEQVTAVQTLGIVVAIYAAGVVLSAWWTRSHRYGPAEWLLRRWTYRSPGSGQRDAV